MQVVAPRQLRGKKKAGAPPLPSPVRSLPRLNTPPPQPPSHASVGESAPPSPFGLRGVGRTSRRGRTSTEPPPVLPLQAPGEMEEAAAPVGAGASAEAAEAGREGDEVVEDEAEGEVAKLAAAREEEATAAAAAADDDSGEYSGDDSSGDSSDCSSDCSSDYSSSEAVAAGGAAGGGPEVGESSESEMGEVRGLPPTDGLHRYHHLLTRPS